MDAAGEVVFHPLPRLETEEVAGVLEDGARRITRYLRRRGLFDDTDEAEALCAPEDDEARARAELAANAASASASGGTGGVKEPSVGLV